MAAKRAKKFLEHLRTSGEGSDWRRVSCIGPLNQIIQLFIGPDKNRKQIATEQLTKKTAQLLREALPTARVHQLRQEGIVCVSWRPLCRVSCFADGSFDVHWNPKQLDATRIDRAAIVEMLEESSSHGNAEEVEWIL